MERKGFLHQFVSLVSDTEVPDFFALWSAISSISVCLSRKCWINYRPRIFPNLYTVFVAESALCRKSTAIGIAEKLLKSIDDPPRLFAQKATPEGLITLFQEKPKGTYETSGAQGILIADELSTLLDRGSFQNGMIPLLTKIWDSPSEPFPYVTRGRGTELVIDPCLSLLGGTTSVWLKESIPAQAVGGGFTARVIFVTSPRSGRMISWPEDTPEFQQKLSELVDNLNRIRDLQGEFIATPDARKTFDEIYCDFLQNQDIFSDVGLQGYGGRRHVILLKVAMCISAASKSTRTITSDDISIAHDLLRKTELTMPAVIRSIVSTLDGEHVDMVLKKITRFGELTRSSLMRQVSHRLSATQLDQVLETLIRSQEIELVVNGRSQATYRKIS
jgi:hypothetical protein